MMAAWCTAWVSAEERETPGIQELKKTFKKEIQDEVEEGQRQRAKTGVAKTNGMDIAGDETVPASWIIGISSLGFVTGNTILLWYY